MPYRICPTVRSVVGKMALGRVLVRPPAINPVSCHFSNAPCLLTYGREEQWGHYVLQLLRGSLMPPHENKQDGIYECAHYITVRCVRIFESSFVHSSLLILVLLIPRKSFENKQFSNHFTHTHHTFYFVYYTSMHRMQTLTAHDLIYIC